MHCNRQLELKNQLDTAFDEGVSGGEIGKMPMHSGVTAPLFI